MLYSDSLYGFSSCIRCIFLHLAISMSINTVIKHSVLSTVNVCNVLLIPLTLTHASTHYTEEPVLYSANPNTNTPASATAGGNVMMVLLAAVLMGAMYLLGKHSK